MRAAQIVFLGLMASAILTVRFSPNWGAFYYGIKEIKREVSGPTANAVVDSAILSGYSARGSFVIKQAFDLGTEIDDPNHKIVRWRLLVPALGHFLKLPSWLLLGLAHLGCVGFIIVLVAFASNQATGLARTGFEAMCFGIAAGASAPFFTSMGLPGYYDSWLALALVAVSFARRRWVVLIACVLAPWIDERFVIGLPLALCVRWIRAPAVESRWHWLKEQAMLPIILVALYALVRLQLGGSGGSQTVGDYFNQFVFAQKLTVINYIVGAWAGLRVGWFFVATAIAGSWVMASASKDRLQAFLLSLGTTVTAIIGLFTAMDLSRSMVLLMPVVPLGWIYATRTRWWRTFPVAPILALAALVLPARHVVGNFARPVDNLWSQPTPLADAQNTIGVRYFKGEGIAKNHGEALKWFRKAADQGLAGAQDNLGLTYFQGDGIQKDSTEAVKWFRKAADQGLARAQHNLGVTYFQGEGVPRDRTEAAKWFRKAAHQGYGPAQSNLAVLYFLGDGVEKDLVRAKVWWQVAAAQGLDDARKNLLIVERQMNAEQEAQAAELARKLFSERPDRK